MKKEKRQSGFSILEIIVVLFVISFGLMGIVSLTMQNISVQHVNKNNLIASQLAQEGLELVRNMRDTNWLTMGSVPWNQGLEVDGTYKIDPFDGLQAVAGINEAKLFLDGFGFYRHNAATSTNFSRLITITNSSADSLELKSEVQWKNRSNTFSYVAVTELYNWR